jgi:hypothetical protein
VPNPKPPTVDQLRHDIDRGRTGDKVAWPDPASAPLGTDEEAGGDPARPGEVERARRQERIAGRNRLHSGLGYAWVLITLIVLLIAGLLAWLLIAA